MSDASDDPQDDESKEKPERDRDSDSAVLEEAREAYEEDEAALSELKAGMLEDLKFGRMGQQWDQTDINQRKIDGRPCLTINDLPASIRQVVNDARQNRPQIKVRPVGNGADVGTAKVFSGLIKHIEAISDADVAYDTGIDCAASMRLGFIGVEVDYACDDTFDLDIKIRSFPNPLAVTWDSRTEAADSSDWRRAFVVELMDRKDFEKAHPGAKSEASSFADTGNAPWFTSDSVRLANYYKREETERTVLKLTDGTVIDQEDYEANKGLFDALNATPVAQRTVPGYRIIHRLITGEDILEEKRWRGSIIPIVPVYGEMLNVEGKRELKSMVTDAKDSQKLFNLARSAITEMVGRSPKVPLMGPEGVFDVDADKWSSINSKSWANISYDGTKGKPERVPTVDVPAGLIQEALASADDKKRIMGIHDASLGIPGNEISGKAIRYRQHEGDTSNFHFIDNQHRAIRCLGRVLVEMVPQVYSTQRIQRILGEDGKPIEVALGKKPVPIVQDGQVVLPPAPLPPPGFDKVYDLTVGKYDLTVEAGPSYTTQREEAADAITTIIAAAPQTAPILAPILIKNQDFPEAEKISKMLATMMPPQARAVYDGTPPPPPGPPLELMAQMAADKAKAEHEAQLQNQKAQQEFALEKQKAQNRAEIERMQAQADIAVGREKAAAEMQIMREKAALAAELKREEARLAAELKAMGAVAATVQPATPAQLTA